MNLSIYASPKIYTLAMRLLYWPYFEERYRVVAEFVPKGATVVDCCCGDALVYESVKHKNVRYIGLDNSEAMVRAGRDAGLDIRLWNVLTDQLPKAEVVLMQGSLCHFIPEAARIVTKLCNAATGLVVISEPIRSTEHPVVSALSKTFTQPLSDDGSYKGERFTRRSL